MRVIRLARKIVSTLLRDRLYYRGRLLAEVLTTAVRFGILALIYLYVFRLKGGEINGISYQTAVWSMFFYFAFMAFHLRQISRLIMEDVRSGTVELLFSKPISYITYRMWWGVGAGLFSFLFILTIGAIVLYLVLGFPLVIFSNIFLPTFLGIIIFGSILSLFLYTAIGLLAFWIEDINPVFWMVDKTVMILGGSWLPVALFPDLMYKIALYSPFGAINFISHTAYESWPAEWSLKISIQIFWIILVWIAVRLIFKKAREKVFVNGG